MSAPEFFEMREGYACFRPVGQMTTEEGGNLMRNAVAFARDENIPCLLADSTQVSGLQRLDTLAFYNQGKALAEEAQGQVKVALVANEDWIDPQRIGMKVARNRGMSFRIFTDEAEAVAWLLDPEAD